MQCRRKPWTNQFQVSTIRFGAWAVGGTWSTASDDESRAAPRRAVEFDVHFFDTADVG